MSHAPLLFSWRARTEGDVGRKAAGLLALPRAWVPPFAIPDRGLVELVEAGDARRALDSLDPKSRHEIETRLFRGAEHLLVRSDGPEEGTLPGGGLSLACEPGWEGLLTGLGRYREMCGKLGRPIIQRAIEPGLLGAMSNARSRVADPKTWQVEGILDLREPQIRRLRPGRRRGATGALRARTGAELLGELRGVCAHLGAGGRRYRCEWIWDGSRVWLVQADPTPDIEGDQEAMRYLGSRSARVGPPPVEADPGGLRKQSQRFAKLRSRATFAELGMPLVPLQAISAWQWQGIQRPSRWLEELLAEWPRPIVVRCDIARGSEPFLLPRSAPQRSVRRLAHFIEKSLEELTQAGFTDREILFLFSPLIATRVSALAVADARTGSARIDALWGFPDGLLNLPHDSFGVEQGEVIRREIRRKPACLLLEPGSTRRARLGGPLDWEPTLRANEIRQLASWATALSAANDRPFALMALCRVDGRRGAGALLPFHCWAAKNETAKPIRVSPREVVVSFRGRKDLGRKLEPGSTVELRLEEHLDRDIGFIEEVGTWAVKNKATLVFEGSLLGHTRAVLERSGAVVTAPEEFSVDWSHHRPAVVRTSVGIRRVRMVRADLATGARPSDDLRGVVDLSERPPPSVVDADLPGQPAMLMDDPEPQ
jgi:hypothetical protein